MPVPVIPLDASRVETHRTLERAAFDAAAFELTEWLEREAVWLPLHQVASALFERLTALALVALSLWSALRLDEYVPTVRVYGGASGSHATSIAGNTAFRPPRANREQTPRADHAVDFFTGAESTSTQAFSPPSVRCTRIAVDVAPIAVGADPHLSPAAAAVVESVGIVERPLRPAGSTPGRERAIGQQGPLLRTPAGPGGPGGLDPGLHPPVSKHPS
jgi:hypothetical protein